MAEAVADLPAAEILPALYLAEPPTMLRLIRALPEDISRVMLVAHEPGLSTLAAHIDDGRPQAGCARAFSHFPTAAAAVFEVDNGWSDFGPRTARFVAFATPRELQDR